MSDFDTFFAAYPRREGRLAAMREYIHARRRVSAETILAGVERYKEHLPRERRYWKKPENWLADGCWDDEYDDPAPTQLSYSMSDDWFVECRELHNGSCGGSFKHYHRMQIEQLRKEQA